MSTNPGPTTTYRHNICGSMVERHDSGPGIIRRGDVPQVEELIRKICLLTEDELQLFIFRADQELNLQVGLKHQSEHHP